MNRLFVLLPLITFLSTVVVSAHAKGPLPNFSQLCIADLGTGFDWEDGAWKQVNFVHPKYVISKIDYPAALPEDTSESDFITFFNCTIPLRTKEDADYDFWKSYNICIRMQEVGAEDSRYFACNERHSEDTETKKWSVTIECEEHALYMRPNGRFHKGYIHGDLASNPKGDYKDSLGIFVGKCAGITN